ncbi:MAG: lipid-A-disaccharide synthase, partial [Kiritimatiellae bacterium]|nr:lipid-A-disaccharide synthase [Kiritimatiellia bacterium]
MKRLLLLAGEESGVMYAERIRRAVLRARPDAEIRGYGDYGFSTGDLAVMGILAVLRRMFFFMRVRRTMERAIDEWRPDAVCTVDYPGMNLRLAAYAKSRGIRSVHVVCPQVWAWKMGRIPKIEASTDRLCCFFPFEPALFRPGFAEFVGHPLAEDEERRRGEGGGTREGGEGRLLAVLPGSRMGEIRHHLATLLEAVAQLRREVPGLAVSIPAANERALRAIEAEVGRLGPGSGVEVRLGGARELL